MQVVMLLLGGVVGRVVEPCHGVARYWAALRRYRTCARNGLPSGTDGCSKSPSGSCVSPIFSMTRRDLSLDTAVNEITSSRFRSSNATASAARAGSGAEPVADHAERG